MNLRRDDVCDGCRQSLPSGSFAFWDSDRKVAECTACRPQTVAPGASAQRIADRRLAKREQETLARHRFTGGLRMRYRIAPQHERAWVSGAAGERVVGEVLESLQASSSLSVLHDRRQPDSKANFDHVVVARSGVWVIDTKHYQRQRIETRVQQRRPILVVGGRKRQALVTKAIQQASAVRDVLDGSFEVRPALCFVNARWQRFDPPFDVDGVLVMPPDRLQRVLLGNGPITPEGIADITRILHQRLRAA